MLLCWLRWLQVVGNPLRIPAGADWSPLPSNHSPPSHRLPWDRTEEADAARNSLEWRILSEQESTGSWRAGLRRPSTLEEQERVHWGTLITRLTSFIRHQRFYIVGCGMIYKYTRSLGLLVNTRPAKST